MKHTCPACGGERQQGKYLCWNCWWALPVTTRIKLKKRDGYALARLRKLHLALDRGTPIQDVRISD